MNYRIIILLTVYTLFSCVSRSKNTGRATHMEPAITGKWIYIESSGGFTGKGAGYPSGTVLVFSKDKQYSRMEDNNEVQKGEYEIRKGKSIYSEEEKDIITYSNAVPQSYHITGDTLHLADEVHDGFQFQYRRMN